LYDLNEQKRRASGPPQAGQKRYRNGPILINFDIRERFANSRTNFFIIAASANVPITASFHTELRNH